MITIKTPTCLLAVFGIIFLVRPYVGLAQIAPGPIRSLPRFDIKYFPATASSVRAQLESSKDDSVALYSAVRHANAKRLGAVAFTELRTMAEQYPNNANVLAAFCLSYDVWSGLYPEITQLNQRPDRSLYIDAEQEYNADLKTAERIAPNLWLTYLVQGRALQYDHAGSVKFLEKAVSLAPNISVTHCELGNVLSSPYDTRRWKPGDFQVPYNKPTAEEIETATREYTTAEGLDPVEIEAPSSLFRIYSVNLPNKSEAEKAKAKLLSELPQDYKLDKMSEQMLNGAP